MAEEKKPSSIRKWGSVVLAILAFVGPLSLSAWWFGVRPINEMEQTARTLIGSSEVQLVEKLGQPREVVLREDVEARHIVFPFSSYEPKPAIPLENKVLFYDHWNMGIYVYIGRDGKVSQIVRVGT